MPDFRKLSDQVWASPQVDTADIAEAAKQGFTLVINNRPDGEEANQPAAAEIRQATEAAGMAYIAIPIDHSGMSDDKVEAMVAALGEAGERGKVLAFCRSGTRSTFLWSLAQASMGEQPDAIIAAAADAGYNVGMMRTTLQLLRQKAGN